MVILYQNSLEFSKENNNKPHKKKIFIQNHPYKYKAHPSKISYYQYICQNIVYMSFFKIYFYFFFFRFSSYRYIDIGKLYIDYIGTFSV